MVPLEINQANSLEHRRRALHERCARVREALRQAEADEEGDGEVADRRKLYLPAVEPVQEHQAAQVLLATASQEHPGLRRFGPHTSAGATQVEDVSLSLTSRHPGDASADEALNGGISALLSLNHRLARTLATRDRPHLEDASSHLEAPASAAPVHGQSNVLVRWSPSAVGEPSSGEQVRALASALSKQVDQLEESYGSEQQLLSNAYRDTLQGQRQQYLAERREAALRNRMLGEEFAAAQASLAQLESSLEQRVEQERTPLQATLRGLETRNECLCAELRREQEKAEAMGRERDLLLEQLGCATRERDAERGTTKARELDAQASLQAAREADRQEHAKRMAEAHARQNRRVAVGEQGLAILRREMAELEGGMDACRAEVHAQAQQLHAVASRMAHLVRTHEAQAEEIEHLRVAAQQDRESAEAECQRAVEEARTEARRSAVDSLRDMQGVIVSQQRQLRELQALAGDELQARLHSSTQMVGWPGGHVCSPSHARENVAPRGLEPDQPLAFRTGAQGKACWASWACSPASSPGNGGAVRSAQLDSPPPSGVRRCGAGDDTRAAEGTPTSSPTPTSLPATPHPQYTGPRRYSALLDEYMTASRPATGSRREGAAVKSKTRVGRSEGAEQRAACSSP